MVSMQPWTAWSTPVQKCHGPATAAHLGAGSARRRAALLARAAEKAKWGAEMPNDVGLGVATTFDQERDMPTWVACVARVRVDRPSGHIVVERLTLVVDAGTIVHPDSAKAQIEALRCGD
jgi:isoquinoline 1-oxidoreductase subunit beta